jgi:hypothetical protein
MIKALKKLRIEGMFLNIIKVIQQTYSSHYTKWKTETISTKVRKETQMLAFLISIQYSFGITSWSNKTRARNKRDSKEKEEVKLSLFADDMILYLKDPKNSTKNS